MSPTALHKFVSSCLSGWLLAVAVGSATAAPRRNVLFIAVDDLRTELHCFGAEHIRSPHIDALARRGTAFLRAYCQQAVCSPSRTSLMTGLRPDTTKVWDLNTHFRDTVPAAVPLPQHFKNKGYRCVSMGKIYHGGLDDKLSWSGPALKTRGGRRYASPENLALIARLRKDARDRGLKGKALARASKGPSTEMAGLDDAPEALQGLSFAPLLDEPDRPWKRAAFSQYPRGGGIMGYSMRTAGFRLTRWQRREGGAVVATELYDHRKDPAENHNVAADPDYAAALKKITPWLDAGWQGAATALERGRAKARQ